jgi:hypothetical protein
MLGIINMDMDMSSLTPTDIIASQILCSSLSSVWRLFDYTLFLGFPKDKNHMDLSLESLLATISDLSGCLQTPCLKH